MRPSMQTDPLSRQSAFLSGVGLVLDEVAPTRALGHIELDEEPSHALGHRPRWRLHHGHRERGQPGRQRCRRGRGHGGGRADQHHPLPAFTARRPCHRRGAALNQGRTQQLWQVDITDDRGRLIAHGEVRLQNVEGTPQ